MGGDNLPLPSGYMRQLIKDLLVENRLLKSELVLGRRRVRLSDIVAPLLHAVAEHDHIYLYPTAAKHPSSSFFELLTWVDTE